MPNPSMPGGVIVAASSPPTPPASAWATGPLGRLLGEIPLRYARVALIGDLSRGGPRFNNGTATLLELGSKKLAITCSHVLNLYRSLRRSGGPAIFQIGNVKLEPISQLIAEDSETDLAIIRLTEEQANDLARSGAHFFVPASWPPAPVKDGDWVSLGGYPGRFRERVAFDVMNLTSYSIGATPVTSATETKIGCRFERERWVWSRNTDGLVDPDDFGGLSGGPAFVLRPLHWEFAGIMFEFSSALDLMFLRPASAIQEDGSIRALP